jgi:hypothetical protein
MSTTDETRAAAAERLRRLYAGENYRTVYGTEPTGRGHQQRDEQLLIDAYLAENDETPIDKVWLWKIGGSKEEHPDKVTFYRGEPLPIGLWFVDDGWKAMLLSTRNFATCIVRGLKTRGDWLRLAAALRIRLKPQASQ